MSSIGESRQSHQVDCTSCEDPMITLQRTSVTYSNRLKTYSRKGQCKWLTFVLIIILILMVLVGGVLALYITADDETSSPTRAEFSTKKMDRKQYIFEYLTGEKRKEQVIINVKDNYTELNTDSIDVYNHFNKKVSLHRLDVSPGMQVCLVKTLTGEVAPDELEEAFSGQIDNSIEVQSRALYVIDTRPVAPELLEDMAVHQFCHQTKVFSLKQVNETGPEVGLTMEDLIHQIQENNLLMDRFKRQFEPRNNYDQHHSSQTYYCGGPIGVPGMQIPATQYTCTKSKEFCYRSLVNERCSECYHGHNLRTRGCWCPIKAIQTCIRITNKPDKRTCCGIDEYPCLRNECANLRVPWIAPPEITFRITHFIDDEDA